MAAMGSRDVGGRVIRPKLVLYPQGAAKTGGGVGCRTNPLCFELCKTAFDDRARLAESKRKLVGTTPVGSREPICFEAKKGKEFERPVIEEFHGLQEFFASSEPVRAFFEKELTVSWKFLARAHWVLPPFFARLLACAPGAKRLR